MINIISRGVAAALREKACGIRNLLTSKVPAIYQHKNQTMNSTYFQRLNQTLRNHPMAIPFLILDLDRLDHNIEHLKSTMPAGMDLRIVVKSLPSPKLIRYVMEKAGTSKLMVFHQPFLSKLSESADGTVDMLLGKPMPVKTAAYYYEHLQAKKGFLPSRQLQWLIDTEMRLEQYLDLARNIKQAIRVNLEIDVGLHRGGFESRETLTRALEIIRSHPQQLTFSGLMGYDPHVVKLPRLIRSPERAFAMANDRYQLFDDLIRQQFPDLWHDQLTLNGAGSPTISLHARGGSPINEVAAGSALVKPTTFDIPTLAEYQPACFIATPVLKKLSGTTLPGIEKFKEAMGKLMPAYRQSYFIYGGYWKADYVYPEGAGENALFGPSTNQSMINTPPGAKLEVDDFVFLRPQQSEFVFLQFGNILTYREGRIEGEWPVF